MTCCVSAFYRPVRVRLWKGLTSKGEFEIRLRLSFPVIFAADEGRDRQRVWDRLRGSAVVFVRLSSSDWTGAHGVELAFHSSVP